MTADEARDRVGEIRAGADRIMRALSVPGPDWKAAEEAASDCVRMSAEMQARCWMEDFERRRVAAELRSVDMFDGFTFGCRWADLIFGEKPKCVEQRLRCGDCATRALRYLADLIEPSEPKVKCVAEVKVDGERLEKLAHDAAVEYAGVDRDALLELADEMDDLAEAWGGKYPTNRVAAYARSIREALGVSDD